MNNNKNGQSAAEQKTLKDIPGFEGIYAITTDGQVWSYRNNKFLKIRKSHNGYLRVQLNVNGKPYEYRINRLVAMTYLPNPNGYEEVNHKDFNILNNSVDNLEWVSHLDNMRYSRAAGHFDILSQPRKSWTFTNVYNGEQFTIVGINACMKHFGFKSSGGMYKIMKKHINNGDYATTGKLKGLRIDECLLKVQRPTASHGVDLSKSK